MNHWAWRGDIQQLLQMFQNTLPLFDNITRRFYTRYKLFDSDVDLTLPTAVIQPASLTIFDGSNFLRGEPMMYGKWRRNGLPGTASLADGLAELLRPDARRDDPALCVMEDARIGQSASAKYFTLRRLHADRLTAFSPIAVERLLETCRIRTSQLLQNARAMATFEAERERRQLC